MKAIQDDETISVTRGGTLPLVDVVCSCDDNGTGILKTVNNFIKIYACVGKAAVNAHALTTTI